MPWLSKTVISRRRSKYSPELLSLDPATPAFGYSLDMIKMELASDTGKGRRTTEFPMAKRAALAAIQTEKVRSTVRAKPLSRHKERAPYFKSRRNASMVCDPLAAESEMLPDLKTGRRLGFSTHRRRRKFPYHCGPRRGCVFRRGLCRSFLPRCLWTSG